MGDILIFARIDPKIFPLDATLSRCSMHICASIKNRKNWDTIGHVLFFLNRFCLFCFAELGQTKAFVFQSSCVMDGKRKMRDSGVIWVMVMKFPPFP